MNGLITVGVPLFRKSGSKLVHFPVNNGKQEFLRKPILIFFHNFLFHLLHLVLEMITWRGDCNNSYKKSSNNDFVANTAILFLDKKFSQSIIY